MGGFDELQSAVLVEGDVPPRQLGFQQDAVVRGAKQNGLAAQIDAICNIFRQYTVGEEKFIYRILLEYTGEGGPTVADQAQLMKTLKNRPAITASEFDASLGYLRKSATENLETYKELKKYVATQRSLLASIPTAWPVRGWITSRFGMRQSPFWDGLTFHQGLDIANEEGTSVKAPADGVVVYSGSQGSYGNLVVLDHGYGYSTRYGHLQRCLVNVGQRVKRGQVVAFLGDTGRATAPHLHYEIRVHGIPVDPLKYLKN